MIIESLRLFYHLRCFQCCVCQVQLGNGASGTDVRVRNNKLHCQNCYSNDEGMYTYYYKVFYHLSTELQCVTDKLSLIYFFVFSFEKKQ